MSCLSTKNYYHVNSTCAYRISQQASQGSTIYSLVRLQHSRFPYRTSFRNINHHQFFEITISNSSGMSLFKLAVEMCVNRPDYICTSEDITLSETANKLGQREIITACLSFLAHVCILSSPAYRVFQIQDVNNNLSTQSITIHNYIIWSYFHYI